MSPTKSGGQKVGQRPPKRLRVPAIAKANMQRYATTMEQFLKEVGDIVAPKDDDDEEALIHPYGECWSPVSFFTRRTISHLLYRNITKTEQLEKAAVLQDARIFHDSILVREHPRKCCRILAQIIVRNIYYISLYYITCTLTNSTFIPSFLAFIVPS